MILIDVGAYLMSFVLSSKSMFSNVIVGNVGYFSFSTVTRRLGRIAGLNLIDKKYRILLMKILFPFFLFLTACVQTPPDLSESARSEIISADSTMSALAGKEGFYQALLSFAHDSLIKPDEGRLPILGKEALKKEWASASGSKEISWKPFRAEASRSGELGYTFGIWKLVTPDTSYYGNYFTAWKKGADSSWKWIVDGGNNTPVPQWTF